ncbi:MAG: peptidylprolyl isomerase [Scytonematopsis contorta HA4267-MV1]|jgi:parvulin-like peptidyl-prolyl isomerase|nr:peptidylprolyl isomerase [Scytonematopsis contorta HA4267-MV1]
MYNLPKIEPEAEEVIQFLKTEMNWKDIYQSILFQRLISQAAAERGIIVTSEEIEAEAERQRRDKGLEKASDTVAWLSEQLVTIDDWEIGIRNHLLMHKLRLALFGAEVERFFIQNRVEFEQAILYQITVNDEKLAQELYFQIEESEVSFYDAAHLYDINEARRQKCGYEGKIHRWAFEPHIAATIFGSSPKELIGPLKTDKGYHLFLVEELIPAELTPQRYQEILNNMFQQWLSAELEWGMRSSP